MSYILEALRKSEQERKRDCLPDIQSIHQSFQPSSTAYNRYKILSYILFILVFMLSVWLFIDFLFESEKVPTNKLVPDHTNVAVDNVPVNKQQLPVAESENNLAVVELWELPDPVQEDIPAMTFSFHVYSDVLERRSVIINGRRLKEGGLVNNKVKLLEITSKGVVLTYLDYRFYIPVVGSW